MLARRARLRPVSIPAAAVILATGGFDWDEDLRRSWHPAAQRATGAAPGNDGDPLRIAARLGAATDNLDQGWWMPMLALPGEELGGRPYYRSLIRERAVPRQIMVNAAPRAGTLISAAVTARMTGTAATREQGRRRTSARPPSRRFTRSGY